MYAGRGIEREKERMSVCEREREEETRQVTKERAIEAH